MTIDHIYIVGFVGHACRVDHVRRELQRVGLGDIPTDVQWGFPNPFDKLLSRCFPMCDMMLTNLKFFNTSSNHYRAIKTSWCLGHNGILICEDDCRFHKDSEYVKEQFAKAPPDADLILFDAIMPKKAGAEHYKELTINEKEGYCPFDSMRSAACYYVSRACMERLIWLYESVCDRSIPNRKARICDQWFDRKYLNGLVLSMAVPNLAVQQVPPTKPNSGWEWAKNCYEGMGIDRTEYAKWRTDYPDM